MHVEPIAWAKDSELLRLETKRLRSDILIEWFKAAMGRDAAKPDLVGEVGRSLREVLPALTDDLALGWFAAARESAPIVDQLVAKGISPTTEIIASVSARHWTPVLELILKVEQFCSDLRATIRECGIGDLNKGEDDGEKLPLFERISGLEYLCSHLRQRINDCRMKGIADGDPRQREILEPKYEKMGQIPGPVG